MNGTALGTALSLALPLLVLGAPRPVRAQEEAPASPAEKPGSPGNVGDRGDEELERRVEALEERLRSLESGAQQPAGEAAPPDDGPDSTWTLVRTFFEGVELYASLVGSYSVQLADPPGHADVIPLRQTYPDHQTFAITWAKLGVARPTGGEQEFDAGFRLEVVAGRGVVNSLSLDPEFLGDEPINLGAAYATIQTPFLHEPLQLHLGRVVSWFGIEPLDPAQGLLVTDSFIKVLTPNTLTGAFLETALPGDLEAVVGVLNRPDRVVDNNDAKTVAGSLRWLGPKDLTLALHGIVGPEQDDDVSHQRWLLDLQAQLELGELTTVWVEGVYGQEEGAAVGGGVAKFGGGLAIVRQVVWRAEGGFPHVAVAARAEVFRDGGGSETGVRQTLSQGSIALDFRPVDHAWLRVEYRLDHSTEDFFPGHRGTQTRKIQETVVVAMAVAF